MYWLITWQVIDFSAMKCQYFDQNHCLSCHLLSRDYLSSITSKEQTLARLFPGDIDKIKPSVTCAAGADGSRNKAKLAAALIDGEITFGYYDHLMQFKELEKCPLHAPAINDVLPLIRQQLALFKIPPYDLAAKNGELKYLLITYSETTNELLIRFVLRSKNKIDEFKSITANLLKLNQTIKVVTVNIQGVHQAILEGDEEIVLTESDYIAHHFDRYVLFQGPRSFFQTNTGMAHALYQQFQREISGLNIHSFLDLYCGVGAFSFFASQYCSNVTGIEISDAAIYYANKAREINDSHDIDFIAMDVEAYLKNQTTAKFDAIMVNPPRRGLNKSIIESILQMTPMYLFYSSCNAETLGRDLLLLETQYQVKSLQIFDMFPFTSHFETLTVLVNKQSN